jgi:hypothetical protein
MQIDALDPGTGKALNWYGTADGQHGVTALMVVGTCCWSGTTASAGRRLPLRPHGQLPDLPGAAGTPPSR